MKALLIRIESILLCVQRDCQLQFLRHTLQYVHFGPWPVSFSRYNLFTIPAPPVHAHYEYLPNPLPSTPKLHLFSH